MKYYAVRKGKVTGIFTVWDECQDSVKGYPGAEFKSFKTQAEAEEYLAGQAVSKTDISESTKGIEDLPEGFAFVDGSFNQATGVYGYGGFLMTKNGPEYFSGNGNDPEMASMRNVAGEISGAMRAVELAKQTGMSKVIINYDYSGIEQWAIGGWKCNKTGTKAYAEFMKKAGITIEFRKIKGHTGVPGNEKADQLAKEACGVR